MWFHTGKILRQVCLEPDLYVATRCHVYRSNCDVALASPIGLASATSQLDRNAWQRVATYKSGSKQTWRRIFFVWNHIEKA